MVADWQATDVMPIELIDTIGKIVAGCVLRYYPGSDIEECTQRALLVVLRRKHKFDPSRNLFAYFSTLCLNEIRLHLRERMTYSKRHQPLPDEDD